MVVKLLAGTRLGASLPKAALEGSLAAWRAFWIVVCPRDGSIFRRRSLTNSTFFWGRSGDPQVFAMQQRALGESLAVREDGEVRCMRYSAFLQRWSDAAFRCSFDPIVRFADRLEPTNAHRWKRLELVSEALKQLHDECARLLTTNGRVIPDNG